MLIHYLLIPILLGVSVRECSAALKDFNATDVDAGRLAKSQLIRKYMNESIDPCEDFYKFACGNWRTHHPATMERHQTRGIHFSLEDFNRILMPLLNETDDKYTESEGKAKNFFDSCKNLSSLTLSQFRQNMKKLVKEFGRMPALEGKKWQQKNFDWIKTIGEISYKYGIGIIFGYSVTNAKDPSARQLNMHSKLLWGFPDTSAETINERKSKVEENLKKLIGVKPKTAKQTAKEIVDFAVKLWKANGLDGVRSETTFAEMHQKYSHSMDVMKLVNISFGFIPSGEVVDWNPNFVEAVGTIAQKTPKRALANYIFYSLMLKFDLNQSSDKTNLSRSCLEGTKEHFSPILNNMAYRRSHLNETEPEFRRLWQGISATLQTTLESNELRWFDDESREAALEKLHLMKLYIGSYEDLHFDELYKDLTLSSSDFMENEKSIKCFHAKQTRKSLNEQRNDEHADIGDLSPSHMFTSNIVRFPMSSLLTDFLWSKNAPHAFNYGRLGFITAHEIMHGFSGGGRYFNKLGVFIDWIYKDIEEGYEERRQCYYDQYHNFTVNNKPLPQDKSQAENLADNGGIYLAYHTYLRWLADETRSQEELDMETLPHLNYTNKQLFFIGYSQIFCSDKYPHERFEIESEDEHSPDEFRGFVPLLNFGEFAKEFNCPSGSPMNPRQKCSIY